MAAATFKEIKDNCPGCTADFVVKMLDQGADIATAQRAWMKEQNAELDRLKRGGGGGTAAAARPGVRKPKPRCDDDPECDDDDDDDDEDLPTGQDAIDSFNGAVLREMDRNGQQRQRATNVVCKRAPRLHMAYLLATNPDPEAQDAIRLKFKRYAAHRQKRADG